MEKIDWIDRNWAWHVRYHRDNVRQLKQQLAYHESKLMVAQTISKEKEPCATNVTP